MVKATFPSSRLVPSSPRSPSSPDSSSEKAQSKLLLRARHSTSDFSDPSDLATTVKVASTHGTSSSPTSSNTFDEMQSTFRDRSISPATRSAPDWAGLRPESPDHPPGALWWRVHAARPWEDPLKKKTILSEQTKALDSTRKRVAQAVASALGTAADIAHEALYIGVNLLDLAPIPGLKPAAMLLLKIWDASQKVDTNRLACLRLTGRCAELLISVREEVSDAGDVLGRELAAPIQKLEESYHTIYQFLIKQVNRPFLKRYLKRDEILQDISNCNDSLQDALGLFGISIQIRILRQVQPLLEAITTGRLPLPVPDSEVAIEGTTPPSSTYHSVTVANFTTNESALGALEDDTPQIPPTSLEGLPPLGIIPVLTSLHSVQNSLDKDRDTTDLRLFMRAALQTMSDTQMIEILQVDRGEMLDAIKTLQRALKHVAGQDNNGVDALPGKGVVVTNVVKEVEGLAISLEIPENMTSTKNLTESGTIRGNTLDREFIESGINALQRMSVSRDLETLPSWTITKYEVDRDKKIGFGFFSDVYKGTWRGQVVAIKVLAETTPRKLFISEIGIWKTLHHPNVLPLYGASSASGDPPWFFVSSYLKNGSLVEYLRRAESEPRPSNLGLGMGLTQVGPLSSFPSIESRLQSGMSPASQATGRRISPSRLTIPDSRGTTPPQEDTTVHRECDLFRFMHEITKGMEYLHSQGVLHGDLKGANVLVDDKYRCVIADFGQSEMKSEAYRISGTPLPHGTLRWQSPELMAGQSQLTQASDVWAFSICCVEILTMGRVPWPLMDDDSIRHFILKDDSRPPLPDNSRFNTQGLQDILRVCWSTKPAHRPTFAKLVKYFQQLRKNQCGQESVDSPQIAAVDEVMEITDSPSLLLDLQSLYLPGIPKTVRDLHASPELTAFPPDIPGSTGGTNTVVQTPLHSSRHSSIIKPTSLSEECPDVTDEGAANERQYRQCLTHHYHSSLIVPLWDPSPVEVGAVGHLSKPRGNFVTLFNAFTPDKSKDPDIRALPSILGYGPAGTRTLRHDRRTFAQKTMDGLMPFGPFPKETVSRHYSSPLNAGREMAWLCTETTDYQYLESLDAPRKWFRKNVDAIMQTYGSQYHIQKEDIFLVIGTLCAADYALFASHGHPEGHVHFNVYGTPKNGEPWGVFNTDTRVASGPSYDEPDSDITVQGQKISNHGRPWDAVLLARLRFKPDALEPTSK